MSMIARVPRLSGICRQPSSTQHSTRIDTRYVETWQAEAGLKTYGLAVAEVLEFRAAEGDRFDMTVEEWLAFSKRASFYEVRERAKSMGIQ
jgi:isocitrate lyase